MVSCNNSAIRNAIEAIKKLDDRVEFLVLYGSVAEGTSSPLSDIDIAVYFNGDKKERFDFRIKVLGRLDEKFDIQIFQDLPLYIRNEIVKKGKILYYRDHDTIFDVYLQSIKEYDDFEKHLNTYYSSIGAGIIEETG